MNLENLNVAELSAQEVRETEGGITGLEGFLLGTFIGGFIYECVSNWDENVQCMKDSYNEARNRHN